MPPVVTWALSHIPQLIFAFVLLQVVRAIFRAAQLSKEHQATTSETDEQRRVREIQERIRKKIAERRGTAAPLAPAREETAPSAPLLRPPTRVPQLEPFGGPSRRVVFETERRVLLPAEPPPIDTAALERQQRLAEQIRALDEARVATLRRAAQVVTQRENAAASSSAATATHAGWLGDLRDPQALRRAFVLREVLGPPVALR
jgi:hypothetical protein